MQLPTIQLAPTAIAWGIVAGLFFVSPVGHAAKTHFHPSWLKAYRVRLGFSESSVPNASFLYGSGASGAKAHDDLFSQIINDDHVKQWRAEYQDRTRAFEMRQRAGLVRPDDFRDYTGSMQDWSNGVLTEIQKTHMRTVEKRAAEFAKDNQEIRPVALPAMAAVGVYVGRPVKVISAGRTQLNVRTNLRSRYGSVDFVSPFGDGAFEFRPTAPASREMLSGSSVDFRELVELRNPLDYSAERYQFMFTRSVPWVDVTSQIFYGASSRTFVGSLSKRLTANLTCVVDSIYWLEPTPNTRSEEQKVRLRYDIHF